jgi:hypothetical protein
MGAMTNPLDTIAITPYVSGGQLRFVLAWPDAPADLDLHAIFKISRLSKCEVFFGKKICGGVDLDVDNLRGGKNGVETITIRDLGQYVYTFAVHRYLDNTNGISKGENPIADSPTSPNSTNSNIPRIPLKDSKATVSVYVGGFKGPVHVLEIPSVITDANADPQNYNWWTAFCLDGKVGMRSLTALDELSANKPNYTKCEEFYNKPKPAGLLQKTMNVTPALLQKSMKKKDVNVKLI